MKRIVVTGLTLLIGVGATLAEQPAPRPPIEPVLDRMLEEYVRPGYADFNWAATALESAAGALCASPSVANLETTRSVFRSVAGQWARIEWLRLGPVMSENRLERILFFPDRKGTGRKQVQSAILSKDKSVTDVRSLTGKSVAMQGLGALEFILFGNGSYTLALSKGDHRCAFAYAVAANLVKLSGEIVDRWSADSVFLPVFLKPSASNPLYRTDQEALNVLLGQMIHGLEAMRDARIGAFLDTEDPDHNRPKSALFWRSGMTMSTIGAGLSGLEAMFNNSGIEVMAADMSPKIAAMIRFEFTQAIRTADSLNEPLAVMLTEPKTYDKLVYLAYAIKIIIGRLDQEFAQAGGQAVGFSFGDGD